MDYKTKSTISSNILNTIPKEANADSFYTMIVEADKQGFDSVDRYIPLDLVNSMRVDAQSDITSYPLVTGDIMSDHKYDQPKTVSISGMFSLNGKFNSAFSTAGDGGSRLKNIEEYFFAVRKYGKLIAITCISHDGTRFTSLDNLAISSMSFERKYNSINFSFTLKEVYFFSAESDVEISENLDDPNAVTLGDFKQLDFTEEVLTTDAVDQMTIEQLSSAGLIASSFGEGFLDMVNQAVVTGISVAVGVLIYTLIINALVHFGVITAAAGITALSGLAAVGAVPVVGWVAIGIAVVVGIATFAKMIYNWVKKGQLISEFVGYDNKTDMQNESNRFVRVLLNVRSQFNKVANSMGIKCYGFTSNSVKQEMYLTIDDEIYQFNIEKGIDGFWGMKVAKIDGTSIETKNTAKMVGKEDVLSLKRSDAIFRTKNYTGVYLVNKAYALLSLSDDDLKKMLDDAWKNKKCDFLGYTQDEMKNADNPPSDLVTRFRQDGVYKDLTQFVLVVTNTNLEKSQKEFENAIYNCFKKEAYE